MERNKASSLKSDTFEIPREKKRSIQESKMEAEHISSPMKSTKKIAKPIDTSDNDAYEPFSENKVSYFSSSSSNNNQPILSEKELYRQHYSVLKNALQNSNVQKREPFIPPSDICGSQNPVIYQNNSYFIPKLGQYVESMVDHTHLLEKPEGRLEKELWRAYSKYGFLYMRGIMGRQLSTDAQHAVLGSLTEMQYTAGEEDDWKPRKKTGWTIEINSGQVIGGTYENDLISEKTGVSCDTAEMNDIWAGVGKLPSVQVSLLITLIKSLNGYYIYYYIVYIYKLVIIFRFSMCLFYV